MPGGHYVPPWGMIRQKYPGADRVNGFYAPPLIFTRVLDRYVCMNHFLREAELNLPFSFWDSLSIRNIAKNK